jgi:hypothetical protein
VMILGIAGGFEPLSSVIDCPTFCPSGLALTGYIGSP